jgi:putative endonuclease
VNKQYCVYILTNQRNTVLYTGVTGQLLARMDQHRGKLADGFTKKYNVDKLVYYELYDEPLAAIAREKQIKAGSRKKKVDLIVSKNPMWEDLCDRMFSPVLESGIASSLRSSQ